MLKTMVTAVVLCTYGITAQAARMQLFCGYSHPKGITKDGKSRLLVLSHLEGFSLFGVGVNAQPVKYLIIESSLFVPGLIARKCEKTIENTIDRTCLTLVGDLTAKIILPIPKAMSYTTLYAKTGPWGLHTIHKGYYNDKIKSRRVMSGYGWAFGGGITIKSLPFWPRLPLDVSAVYYMPATLKDYLPNLFEHNCIQKGFWTIKIGLMSP